MNRKLAVLMLIAEILAAGYVALIAGLMSAWMVDDDQACRMRDLDWVVLGCRRFVVVLIVAVAFALIARPAHRRWVSSSDSTTWWQNLPFALGGCIALSGAVGAAWFMITRPFI